MYEYNPETAASYQNLDGVMVKPPQRLTAQFLLSNKLPVFVLTAIPPQSVLTFTIKQSGGLPGSPLRINRSKLPFNVTKEVPADTLRNGGKDVWGAVDKGMLVLVWPADAEKMLGSNAKSDEADRQKVSKWSSLNTEKSEAVKENERILKAQKKAEEDAALEQETNEETADPVNARVMDIMARVTAGELKLDKAVAEFDDLSDILVERDYQYAILNTKSGKLREWLQAALAKGVTPTPVKKPKKKAEEDAPVRTGKKSAKASTTENVFDDSEPEMTEEEKEAEALAEAQARQRQRLNG